MRGTNWSALRVDEMWSMIARHDGAAHQQLIGGWRKSYELVLQHISGVQRYREGLAAAWPPNRSPAAAAYMERLDALIANLWDTYEASIENHRALNGATGALDSARRSMDEIQREHAANEVRLAAYREETRVHHLLGGKAKGMPPQLPVPDGRQAELEQRARTVMSNLSNELAQAQVSLIRPRLYSGPTGVGNDSRAFGRNTRRNFPLPAASPTLNKSRDTPGSGIRRTPQIGLESQVQHRRQLQFQPGSDFDRLQPVANTPTSSGQNFPASRSQGVGARPKTLPFPGVIQPFSSSRGSGEAGSADAPTRSRIVPTNGVLGGLPTPSTPQSGLGSGSMQRVNPVGGVISGYGSPPQPSAPALRDKVSRRASQLDPEDPWRVRQGIESVIKPDPAPNFDPGPVIGRIK